RKGESGPRKAVQPGSPDPPAMARAVQRFLSAARTVGGGEWTPRKEGGYLLCDQSQTAAGAPLARRRAGRTNRSNAAAASSGWPPSTRIFRSSQRAAR